jgi:cytochrome c oxidase subunit 3
MSSSSSSLLHHQFDTIEQQNHASMVGMWAFLVNEVMFFGGLFAAYCVYRYMYHDVYVEGSHQMNVLLGTINTGVLLTSSFTMVLAVHFAKAGQSKKVGWALLVTFILGLAFCGIKSVEYYEKYHHGLMLGSLFHYAGPRAREMQLFMCLYFFMTGLHALHVIIGMGLMVWLYILAVKGKFTNGRYMAVEITGLYWHFVDLVWVFLFPLFYLVGTR